MYKNIILGGSFAFIVALSGCGGAMSEAESLSAAKSAYTEKKYSQASIYLKNILQENSHHAQARYLFGEVYLSLGLWEKSEKEFLKAIEFGLDDKDIYPKLAKAYYYLTDSVGLEELVTFDLPPLSKQTVNFYIALLQTKMGEIENGKTAFNRVVQADENSKYGKLASVHLTAMNQNYTEALSQSGLLLTQYPLFTEALEFEGFLNYQMKRYQEAVEAFKKYLAIHFNAKEIRLMYANALFKSGDIVEAEKEVDSLLELAPKNPMLNEIKAEAYFSRQDYRNAKLAADKTLNVLGNRPMASIIAGVSAYELNEIESAYAYLQPLELYIPVSHPSMILLNVIRFELGYIDDAFISLNNSDDINLSSQILSISARELLLQGRASQAASLIDKALLKEPNNSRLLLEKGVANLATNKKSAKELLTQSIKLDPSNDLAIAILVHAHVVDKNYNAAIELITTIESLHKNYALQLLAGVYKAKGDFEESKKYFSLLVESNADDFKGNLGLASIALLSEDEKLAIDYYQIAYRLKSYKALNQLVKLSKNENFKDQIVSTFEELSLLEEKQSFFKVGYAELLLRNGEIGAAYKVINNALKDHSSDKDVLLYKAKILVLAKQHQEALNILNALLIEHANDFIVLEHKSNVLSLMKEYRKAIEINKRLSKARPQSIKYLVNLINNYIDSGSLHNAKKLIVQLAKLPNASLIASRFNGKVLFIEQKFDQAIPQLITAYKGHQSLDVLVELVQSLQSNGQNQKALTMLLKFEQSNEINIILKFKKAELLQANGQISDAIQEYQNIISLNPKNHVAYHNLAWLYFTEQDYALANSTVTKAFQLDENNDYINHTLGLSQLYLGNAKEALVVLNRFSNSANDSFKVALVEALVANGKVSQARALYDTLNSKNMEKESLVRYEKIRL
jgi:putative PEP-CTERM system TPR-repeat lipoprotein